MELSERKALKESNGKRMDESECFEKTADVKAHEKQQEERKDQLLKEYGSLNNVLKTLDEKMEEQRKLSVQIKKIKFKVDSLIGAAKRRWAMFDDLRLLAKRETTRVFSDNLKNHGMKGSLKIVMQAKVLK